MSFLDEAIKKNKAMLEMFNRADKGERPVCPKCKIGGIISINSALYMCDSSDCGYYIFVRKVRKR